MITEYCLPRGSRALAAGLPDRFLLLATAFLFAVWPGELAPADAIPSPGVVLNELMYHLPKDRDDLQYIEIYNASDKATDLSGWSIKAGVKFKFTDGTQIPPSGFLVICHDSAAFRARYGAQVPVAGDFKGKLSHSGERVELVDATGKTVDAVEYGKRPPWPSGPDGYGASLERICPAVSGTDPENWAPSEAKARQMEGTPGAANSTYSAQPLPRIHEVRFEKVQPGQPVTVNAVVADSSEIQTVLLAWSVFTGPGTPVWNELPMSRQSGDTKQGIYTVNIPAQPVDRLVRFRIRAKNALGLERLSPAKGETRAAYSYTTFVNTNTAHVPFMHIYTVKPVIALSQASQFRGRRPLAASAPIEMRAAWTAAAIYMPPGGKDVQVFDYIRVRARRGGVKMYFHKDQLLEDMSAVAIIDKGPPRWMLTENMSQDFFRRLGAKAPDTEFTRVWLNRRALGYELRVEVPNKSFLRRRGRDVDGNIYKLEWGGDGLVHQHKKMTNKGSGHQDLIQLINGLKSTSGNAQWEFIEKNFNVEQMIDCYVAGLCVQDWDGFFNNYFAYHDLKPGGKWEVYPWDKDKTWGDYDGASPQYDWYSMPLTFGMNTAHSVGGDSFMGFGGGGHQWERPPGWFSGPLLANPEFRKRFLARLRQVNETIFTPETMGPVIRGLANRLQPEVVYRAAATGESAEGALEDFQNNIRSFQDQVTHRREYILKHLPPEAR